MSTRVFCTFVVVGILQVSGAGLLTGNALGQRSEEDLFKLPVGMERVGVSLRTLSERASRALSHNTPLPKEVQNLDGIGYVEGYIVDDSGEKDVILIGLRSKPRSEPGSKGRPTLRLDDLIVNMRNVGKNAGYPLCSLNPRPQNLKALQAYVATPRAVTPSGLNAVIKRVASILGPQDVIVGGVPRNSRHAHVMIEADYHMKKVSQGHITVPGVKSYLDRCLQAARGKSGGGMTFGMGRFWFHVARNAPTYQEGNGIVWLDNCDVVVFTEKQRTTASGRPYDVQEDDPIAIAFKDELSKAIPKLTATVPVYGDLEKLYRLRALLLAMQFRGALRAAGMDSVTFLREYEYQDEKRMAPSLPALVNYKLPASGVGYLPVVCGGVGMDMEVRESSFGSDKRTRLFRVRLAVLRARPSERSLSWVVREVL